LKLSRIIPLGYVFLCVAGFVFYLLTFNAFAADGSNAWRPTYDLIMRWVNFVILAFILVKFGKDPLLKMLGQRKKDLQKEISLAEKQKNGAEDKLQKIREQLDASSERFEEIKRRIIQQGENKKKEMIEGAKKESRILIQEAKRRMDTQILSVQKAFQAEMVEETMKIVFQKLPQYFTEKDNQKLIERYLTHVSLK
jgi:F-type H+-transporting ATPase subunit b